MSKLIKTWKRETSMTNESQSKDAEEIPSKKTTAVLLQDQASLNKKRLKQRAQSSIKQGFENSPNDVDPVSLTQR